MLYAMAKNDRNMGGPTHNPKDEPTDDRSARHAQSRAELTARSVHGARPGRGQRNGSSKRK